MELFPCKVATDIVMQRTEGRSEDSLGFGQLHRAGLTREGVVGIEPGIRAGPREVVRQGVSRHLPGLSRHREKVLGGTKLYFYSHVVGRGRGRQIHNFERFKDFLNLSTFRKLT